jgi:hypothetical protein
LAVFVEGAIFDDGLENLHRLVARRQERERAEDLAFVAGEEMVADLVLALEDLLEPLRRGIDLHGLAEFQDGFVVVALLFLAAAEVVLRFGRFPRILVGLQELAELLLGALVVLALEERLREGELLFRGVLQPPASGDDDSYCHLD